MNTICETWIGQQTAHPFLAEKLCSRLFHLCECSQSQASRLFRLFSVLTILILADHAQPLPLVNAVTTPPYVPYDPGLNLMSLERDRTGSTASITGLNLLQFV